MTVRSALPGESAVRRLGMADIPLAQAHPSEMLAALTATGVGLISLIGLIYARMNKDIDGLSEDIDKLRDDVKESWRLWRLGHVR